MNVKPLQSLPIGTSDFASLRAAGEIYVDKTDLIYELAKERKKIFLTRPRSFGKSLLLTTFESLFRYGLRDFQGLAIEKLWSDTTYSVVRVDFAETDEFDGSQEFETHFNQVIAARFAAAGFQYDPSAHNDMLSQLSLWMQRQQRHSLVLLMDNYDTTWPIMLEDPVLFREIRMMMRRFFTILKSNDRCFRFVLLMGVTKFSNTSVFSDFENLLDISLLPRYGALVGFTEDDLRYYFSEHIEHAAQVQGITVEKLMVRMRSWYSGYSFDMCAQTRVFCPWSVLLVLNNPEIGFQNYWGTGARQPRFLMHYLMKNALSKLENFAKTHYIRIGDLSASGQYDQIAPDVLMVQEGFLTFNEFNSTGLMSLRYPNLEVAFSMAELFAYELVAGRMVERPMTPSLVEVVRTGSIDTIVERINLAVDQIDFDSYPITSSVMCRAMLQVVLMGLARIFTVKLYAEAWRTDMEFTAGSRRWLFEVRCAQEGDDAQSLLNEALDALRESMQARVYHKRTIVPVALLFDAVKRRFTRWQLLPDAQVDAAVLPAT